METTPKIRELIDKANAEITRIHAWIMEHEDAFQYMDLKLHDASFYEYIDMEKDFPLCFAENEHCSANSYFYRFCESSYDQMTEDFNERGIEFKRYQLGRTSSFWLHDESIIQFERYRLHMGGTMDGIMNNLYGHNNWIWYNDNGTINEEKTLSGYEDYMSSEEEILENIENELDFIINEAYDELIKEMSDVLKVYEYIKDFKENQVEYFKEWLQYYEDELQAELDEENAYEEERQSLLAKFTNGIVKEIYDRNRIPNKDLEVLLTQ